MINKYKIQLLVEPQQEKRFVISEFYEPNVGKSIISDFNAPEGIKEFPNYNISLINEHAKSNLLGLQSGDLIKIVAAYQGQIHNTMAGYIKEVEVNYEQGKHTVNLNCTSEFYKLQEVKVSASDFNNLVGFKTIIEQVLTISEINYELLIDRRIDDRYELSIFKDLPALMLINLMCYDMDIIYEIQDGNSIIFKRRKDKIQEINSPKNIIKLDKNSVQSFRYKK